MSNWMTVSGMVEFDLYPSDIPVNLERVFGRMLIYGPNGERDWTTEDWERAATGIMPRGSEGTLRYICWYNPKQNMSPNCVVTITGSLRDYTGGDYSIEQWISGIQERLTAESQYSSICDGVVKIVTDDVEVILNYEYSSGWGRTDL